MKKTQEEERRYYSSGVYNVGSISEAVKRMQSFIEGESYAGCRIFRYEAKFPTSLPGIVEMIKPGDLVTAAFAGEIIFLKASVRWQLIEQIQKVFDETANEMREIETNYRANNFVGEPVFISQDFNELKNFCQKFNPAKSKKPFVTRSFQTRLGLISAYLQIDPLSISENLCSEEILEQMLLGRAKNYIFQKLKEKNAQITWEFA